MTKFVCMALRKRSGFDRLAASAVIALGATLMSPASALAKAQIEGGPEAVRIEAQDSSVEEILAALGDAFDLRYRSSANLDRKVSGTYRGSLERVVRRLLEGYDFVLKTGDGRLEVMVLATPKAAGAVAAAASPGAKPAANPTPASVPPVEPVAPAAKPAANSVLASAPERASGRPAPQAQPAAAVKVADEPTSGVPSYLRADLSKIPGVDAASAVTLSKIPGMRPVFESAPGAPAPIGASTIPPR